MPATTRTETVIAPRVSGQPGHPVPLNAYSASHRVRQTFAKTGKTEQSHRKACDINSIMARFQKTGAVDHLVKYPPRYTDVTGADFTAAQVLVAQRKSVFEELPSQIRAYFENDAANYLNFVADPENTEFLQTEGLQGLLPQEPDTDDLVASEPPPDSSSEPESPAQPPE